MTTLPSAEDLVFMVQDTNNIREKEWRVRVYTNAVLEAAAQELEPDDGWRDDSTHHSTVMHTLKQAAGVIRKLKEEL